MIQTIKTIFKSLGQLDVGDFVHERYLPNSATASVDALVDMFADCDIKIRREIIHEVNPSISFVFFMYARQCAIESVRNCNIRLVTRGLIALAIENDTFDRRDTLVILSLLYHSARKFPEIDADDLFQRIAKISYKPFRENLSAFIDRSENDKSLEAFGLKESAPHTPFSYERIQTLKSLARQNFLQWLRRFI